MHLTPIEYKLLTMLVRHAGKVVTHSSCSARCGDVTHRAGALCAGLTWLTCATSSRSSRARPRYLLTEPGVGYRLAAE